MFLGSLRFVVSPGVCDRAVGGLGPALFWCHRATALGAVACHVGGNRQVSAVLRLLVFKCVMRGADRTARFGGNADLFLPLLDRIAGCCWVRVGPTPEDDREPTRRLRKHHKHTGVVPGRIVEGHNGG